MRIMDEDEDENEEEDEDEELDNIHLANFNTSLDEEL